MKTLLLLLAVLGSLVVVLIGVFQLVRLVFNEVTTLVKEAWQTPEIHG